MLNLLELILAASELSLSCFSVASPFLNLGPELAFKFKFLFLDVLDVMLKLDIFVFVLKLSLSIFFVLAADDGFLFEIFGFQIFSELINLSVQSINHLVFTFDNIFKLDFLSQCLMNLIWLLFHFQMHLLVFFYQTLRLEFNSIMFGLNFTGFVLLLFSFSLIF